MEENSNKNNLNTTNLNTTKRLGSGLSTLLGDKKNKNNNNGGIENIDLIDIDKLIPGIYQPRKNFNQEELEELAKSIVENGLMQPIIVRTAEDNHYFEIIAGERRFRACKIAGLTQIPTIVKKINNHQALELAIVENIQRSDLSLIEEANGYKQLIEEFSYTQEQIANKVGKSRSHIANIIRLLALPKSACEFLEKKLISMGHARAVLSANNPEEMIKKIIANSMTVREVEDEIRNQKITKPNQDLSTSEEYLNQNNKNASGNLVAFIRNEKSIKFISPEHIKQLASQLSDKINCKVQINYNSLKNRGKLMIDFEDIGTLQNLINKLQENNIEE